MSPTAHGLGFEVLICDPREGYAHDWNPAAVRFVHGMPDDAVLAIEPDAHTAVVALTHDPRLDDMALLTALQSEAFYVGALGSRVNSEAQGAPARWALASAGAAPARPHRAAHRQPHAGGNRPVADGRGGGAEEWRPGAEPVGAAALCLSAGCLVPVSAPSCSPRGRAAVTARPVVRTSCWRRASAMRRCRRCSPPRWRTCAASPSGCWW